MKALSEIAELTAREYILSKVPQQRISSLDITVETVGSKPVTISVDIDLALSPLMRAHNARKLVDEATEKALEAVGQYLRDLSCRSKT